MRQGIYRRIGVDTIDFTDHIDQCFICHATECANHHYDNIDKCDKYAPLKPFDEWYTELQAVIYHAETPYANEDGSIDEGKDATAEILSELKKDTRMIMTVIESWGCGNDPSKCYDYLLEDMQP